MTQDRGEETLLGKFPKPAVAGQKWHSAWRDRAERRLRWESTMRLPGRAKKPKLDFRKVYLPAFLAHEHL